MDLDLANPDVRTNMLQPVDYAANPIRIVSSVCSCVCGDILWCGGLVVVMMLGVVVMVRRGDSIIGDGFTSMLWWG